MARLARDVFVDDGDSIRQLTPLTRREIFDYIRTEGGPWCGRLDEIDFLARVYDLEALPSTDYRFKTASGDIWQHRVNNFDWDDDWVFSDSRFELASGADEVLLEFLAQMVHPVVQRNADRAREIVERLNELLTPDGWMLKEHKQMSGRAVYSPTRSGTGTSTAVEFARAIATRIDTAHISQQLTRMEGAVDTDPELAIGTAKEFVESICKNISRRRPAPAICPEPERIGVFDPYRPLLRVGPGHSLASAHGLPRRASEQRRSGMSEARPSQREMIPVLRPGSCA